MTPTQQSSNPVEVFFSYSHKDEELRDELADHLTMLERQHVITAWHDRRIGAGEEWKGAIDDHLNTADVILLLVSSKFLASDYCYDVEMARAMERHEAGEATVIPVILRAVDWKTAPFVRLKALPTDGKPVTSWQNQDEAFADVVKGIRTAINKLNTIPSSRGYKTKIWNIPHQLNPNFTGRKDLLLNLNNALASGEYAALTQVIHGLGGVGKTQIAVQYAYTHANDYSAIWWVRAEDAQTRAEDYAALAVQLNLPEKNAREQSATIEAVRRWLEQNDNWLLIFDNAEDEKDIFIYLPRRSANKAGHVIITSRNPSWRSIARPLSVEVMERNESIELLQSRTGIKDETSAFALAEALGDLPLALEQAGAYIDASGSSFEDYLELFKTHKQNMFKNTASPLDYKDTVATTWDISFEKVRNGSPAAAQLLNLCAYLATDDIPLDLIRGGAQYLPDPLANTVADTLSFNQAKTMLRRYSLAEVADDALSIHRLVQAVTQDKLDEENQNIWCDAALRLVANSFPNDSGDVRTWPECSRLLPHALIVNRHIASLNITPEDTGMLLNQVGIFLKEKAEFTEAKEMFERALRIDEKVFGPNHPTVATRVNNLGGILESLGDLKGAKEHYERVLRIDEVAYGPEHPKVATGINNMGGVLELLGNLNDAKEHYERALRIDEAAYGSEHPKVAPFVNNLGGILESLGDLKGAKEHYERALQIVTKCLGEDHPNTVAVKENLEALESRKS